MSPKLRQRVLALTRTRRARVGAAVAGLALGVVGVALAGTASRGLLGLVLLILGAMLGIALALALVVAVLRQEVARLRRQIDDTRARQSRHEYHQERALADLADMSAKVLADLDGVRWTVSPRPPIPLTFSNPGTGLPRALFVTSNGAGLGHLSRCLAVARAASDELSTAVLTMSTAHVTVRGGGIPVSYFPSQAATGEPAITWNRRFAQEMHQILASCDVEVVVFDGVVVYEGLTQACRRLDVPLVWLRRGNWKAGASRLQRDAPMRHCDLVVVPGDFPDGAGDDPRDGVLAVAPITLARRAEQLSRADACARLGLDPSRRYALVQLGAGALNDIGSLRDEAGRLIHRHGAGVEPVVLRSPVSAARDEIDGLHVVDDVYPLANCLSAFEFAVCAAGYNSVHENIAAALPTVFVPNLNTVTDDQAARAGAVRDGGLGLVAHDANELAVAIRSLGDPEFRTELRRVLLARPEPGGTTHAARIVTSTVRDRQARIALTHPDMEQADDE